MICVKKSVLGVFTVKTTLAAEHREISKFYFSRFSWNNFFARPSFTV